MNAHLDFQHFARVPKAVYQARKYGEITQLMHDILCLLHLWSNHNTGEVQSFHPQRVIDWLNDEDPSYDVPSERTVQRHMQGLREAGWVLSDYINGQKRPYNLTLCNFLAVGASRIEDGDGDTDKVLLNPTKIKHWMKTSIFRGGDRHAEGTLTGRSQDAEGAAKEQTVPKILNKTVDETSSETVPPSSSKKVSKGESGASLPPVPPPNNNPTDGGQEIVEYLNEKSYAEKANMEAALYKHTGIKPNKDTMFLIFLAHSDFPWGMDEAMTVIPAVLSASGWKKNIKTPDDFRRWWQSSSDGSLWKQCERNMPDPTQGGLDPDESVGGGSRKFEMQVEFVCDCGVVYADGEQHTCGNQLSVVKGNPFDQLVDD